MLHISYVENEDQLKPVLALCYQILGKHLEEVDHYRYDDWKERINCYSPLLIYAQEEGKVIAAVLGRPENADSLVMGFVACDQHYRKRGITSELIRQFERNARSLGFKYITLGSDKNAEGFYQKCGYRIINEIHGQKIFQKRL